MLATSTADLFSSAGGVITALVVLIAALGAAVAVFKANSAQTTIKVLQDNCSALKDQNGIQQHQLNEHRDTIDKQRQEIATLKDLVQSKAAVEALAEQVATNHAEVIGMLKAVHR